jgi:hypothetical protein
VHSCKSVYDHKTLLKLHLDWRDNQEEPKGVVQEEGGRFFPHSNTCQTSYYEWWIWKVILHSNEEHGNKSIQNSSHEGYEPFKMDQRGGVLLEGEPVAKRAGRAGGGGTGTGTGT